METSPTADDTQPLSTVDNSDKSLQPFFVLHKAIPRKCEKKPSGSGKSRRKIDLSPPVTKNVKKTTGENDEEDDDSMRMEYFSIVWSKIQKTIKDVLRDANGKVFDEIHHWVRQSFGNIKSSVAPGFAEATRSYPIIPATISKQLFTGLVLTRNMEFVDDLLTFEDLGLHLKSHGCHVANLSSLDFSTKNGIGGCLKSLLRQFLLVALDAADISILASWYRGHDGYNNPIVIIIEDMERCCGSILSDFILMLSEWAIKIPVILMFGIATTFDAPRHLLTSNALQHLFPHKFMLGSPADRMDAVVAAVLLRNSPVFNISHKVASVLRNYFVNQDGTLTSFIRALKMACLQHFLTEPLAVLLKGFFFEDDNQVSQGEKHGLLTDTKLKQAFDLPSYAGERHKEVEQTGKIFMDALSSLKSLQKHWSIAVMCLYESAKYANIRLLDILCEALNPKLYNSRISSDTQAKPEKLSGNFPSSGLFINQHPSLRKKGYIDKAVRIVRDLPTLQLYNLLKSWAEHTADIAEVHEDVKTLISTLISDEKKRQKEVATGTSKRVSRGHSQVTNEKAAMLINSMVRDHMQPLECIPFHEIICFKNVEKLQLALIGDPRRRIQIDLLESHKLLNCNCCSSSGSSLSPFMHDTSIMYNLAQEHGDLINLQDWFQSFKSIVASPPPGKVKKKLKQSPLKKKRRAGDEPQKPSEVSLQAKYCTAVTELQITGLIRMPSKRRPDFAHRVAFGL